MYVRWAALLFFSLCAAFAAFAQSPSKNRIDLGELQPLVESSASAIGRVFVGFRPTDVSCPEQHGTIEIKSGQMSLHRFGGPRGFTFAGLMRDTRPIDDYQWQYRVGNLECNLTLNIKLQLRTEGGTWRPVMLPWLSRPSILIEEKTAWMRDTLARARTRTTPPPQPPRPAKLQSLGEVSATSVGFFFEETGRDQSRPRCFHAIGTYDINQYGVAFAFLGGLNDINRFVIARNEINRYATRLDFIGGECRFQVTVSGSTWYNFDWAPLEIE